MLADEIFIIDDFGERQLKVKKINVTSEECWQIYNEEDRRWHKFNHAHFFAKWREYFVYQRSVILEKTKKRRKRT